MLKFSLLILCAGFGKRMLELTTNTPKPLLKFNNKILLNNTINFFKSIGCNEFFINTHYLNAEIEKYVNKNFSDTNISLIYEPSILGTGGGIKNVFNYTDNKKICVVNSDIFWKSENKIDINNFLKDFNEINHCKILLSKNDNFYGLKKTIGDFNIKNDNISYWIEGNELNFYSGFQIVSKNIFKNTNKNFSMNDIWKNLINAQSLRGAVMNSNLFHIGDKNSIDIL